MRHFKYQHGTNWNRIIKANISIAKSEIPKYESFGAGNVLPVLKKNFYTLFTNIFQKETLN